MFSVVWTLPLALHFTTALPGAGAGDNLSFLWNFWWMREARASAHPFFDCPFLFAPNGVDLTLHTHTALPAFIGATALSSLPPIAALNLTIIISIFLAGLCTYLLAWRLTGHRAGSLVAGVIFAGSPYMAAHLNGHFNLTHAWVIPLFALVASEAIRSRQTWWGVCAGVISGVTAYIDYYYVIYQAVLLITLLAFDVRGWRISMRGRSETSRVLPAAVGIAILLVTALLTAITLFGGFAFSLGQLRVSARSAYNPVQIFWILVALWLWLRLRPAIGGPPNPGFDRRASVRLLVGAAAAFLLLAAPLIVRGIRLSIQGEYVTHQYTWRSGPDGIDASTLFMGNPFHPFWGDSIRQFQQSRGINVIESSAWLGVAVLLLAVWTLRHRWRDPVVRRWAAVGALFFIWALGPHLMILGVNTGLPLPTAVLRYLPIVSNVRIPGRAVVLVYLSLALLSAMAIAAWRVRPAAPRWLPLVVMVCVLGDFVIAPIRMTALPRSTLDDLLRQRSEEGALCELPLGVRDGFGERGDLDEWILFRQTVHERPLVGGFVARLSPSVVSTYESDPLLSALLRLSAGNAEGPGTLPDRRQALDLLRRHGVSFVTLNRRTASPELTRYVTQVLPLTLIAEDAERSLYLVTP